MSKEVIINSSDKCVTFPTIRDTKGFEKYLKLWFNPSIWESNKNQIRFLSDHFTKEVMYNFVRGYVFEFEKKYMIITK